MFLQIAQAVILLMFQLEYCMSADPLDGVYPDVTNCFKDVERVNEKRAIEQISFGRDDCKVTSSDEDSVCFKNCMLESREMIGSRDHPPTGDLYERHHEGVPWDEIQQLMDERRIGYNYCINADVAAVNVGRLLGIKYSSLTAEQTNRVVQLIAKCDEKSFIVPIPERMECEDLAPEYQTQLGELISCLEDVLKVC